MLKWPRNKGTMFSVSISYTIYILTHCSYFKPLDYFLKPPDTRISNDENLPWQSYKHSTFQQPFHILLSIYPACSATSRYFHLPPHYEDDTIMMNVYLDTTNINTINTPMLDFRIWQHFSSNCTPSHLQKLTNVPEVLVEQLYRHMINTNEPAYSFTIKDDDKDSSLIWTILMSISWDILRDYWYDFSCMYMCLLL